MVELAQVESRQFTNLFEAVHERVTVDEQFTGRLGDVQVVLEEGTHGIERLVVERLERAAAEHLLQKHLAQRRRQLVDQPPDAEVLVGDRVLRGIEHLADLERDARLLIGAGKILDVGDDGGDTDRDVHEGFRIQRLDDVLGDLADVRLRRAVRQLLHQRDVLLPDVDDIVMGAVGVHTADDLIGELLRGALVFDDVHDALFLGAEAQLLGFRVDVARQDIVEHDIFNKRREKLENIRERGKLEKNEYSISVHVWLLEDDKLWIQQRSNEKKMFPGLWEQSGGGVISGETSLEAVKRETKEELGLDIQDEEITYIGSYTRVKDIVDIWLVQRIFSKDKIILQDEEVANIKNVTFEEFDKMIENKEVVPTINPSYNLLKNYYDVYMKGEMLK